VVGCLVVVGNVGMMWGIMGVTWVVNPVSGFRKLNKLFLDSHRESSPVSKFINARDARIHFMTTPTCNQ